MAWPNFSVASVKTVFFTGLNTLVQGMVTLFRDQATGDQTNQIRYNSTAHRLEYWTGSAWAELSIIGQTITNAGNASTLAGALPSAFATAAQGALADGYTAADVLAKLLTVDGPASGLDAASVDGYHASPTPGDSIIPVLDANGKMPAGTNIAFRGAFVYNASPALTTSGSPLFVLMSTELYDTSSIHDPALLSRLAVPTGVTKVRLAGFMEYGPNAVGSRSTQLFKNGLAFTGGVTCRSVAAPADGNTNHVLSTPVLAVSSGDYFEIRAYQDSGNVIYVSAWLSLEVVE